MKKMSEHKLPAEYRKRVYCCIHSCKNFKGTTKREHNFFRPPLDRQTSDKWIEAIGKHQIIRHLSMVCELHFNPEDIINKNISRRKLKDGAVPTIFEPNLRAIKIEPTVEEPVHHPVELVNIQQHSNGNDSMDYFDQNMDVQELHQKLELQIRLTEYWKSIALKYEPNHADPHWTLKSEHIEEVKTERLDAPPPSPPPKDIAFKPYQCATCNECFEKPSGLERHIHVEHISRQTFQSAQKCIVCCKRLIGNEIDWHLCTDLEQISCDYCEKVFRSTSQLYKHLNTEHSTSGIYVCDKCPQKLRMGSLMNIHVDSHEREHPEAEKGGSQSCAICGLSFQQIDEFKQHMQKHNQTFGCGFCRQRFKTNFALKKHHEREHESTVATQMDTECENS